MICYKLKQVMTNPSRNNEQKFYRSVLFVIENLVNEICKPFFISKDFRHEMREKRIDWLLTNGWTGFYLGSSIYDMGDMDNIITSI